MDKSKSAGGLRALQRAKGGAARASQGEMRLDPSYVDKRDWSLGQKLMGSDLGQIAQSLYETPVKTASALGEGAWGAAKDGARYAMEKPWQAAGHTAKFGAETAALRNIPTMMLHQTLLPVGLNDDEDERLASLRALNPEYVSRGGFGDEVPLAYRQATTGGGYATGGGVHEGRDGARIRDLDERGFGDEMDRRDSMYYPDWHDVMSSRPMGGSARHPDVELRHFARGGETADGTDHSVDDAGTGGFGGLGGLFGGDYSLGNAPGQIASDNYSYDTQGLVDAGVKGASNSMTGREISALSDSMGNGGDTPSWAQGYSFAQAPAYTTTPAAAAGDSVPFGADQSSALGYMGPVGFGLSVSGLTPAVNTPQAVEEDSQARSYRAPESAVPAIGERYTNDLGALASDPAPSDDSSMMGFKSGAFDRLEGMNWGHGVPPADSGQWMSGVSPQGVRNIAGLLNGEVDPRGVRDMARKTGMSYDAAYAEEARPIVEGIFNRAATLQTSPLNVMNAYKQYSSVPGTFDKGKYPGDVASMKPTVDSSTAATSVLTDLAGGMAKYPNAWNYANPDATDAAWVDKMEAQPGTIRVGSAPYSHLVGNVDGRKIAEHSITGPFDTSVMSASLGPVTSSALPGIEAPSAPQQQEYQAQQPSAPAAPQPRSAPTAYGPSGEPISNSFPNISSHYGSPGTNPKQAADVSLPDEYGFTDMQPSQMVQPPRSMPWQELPFAPTQGAPSYAPVQTNPDASAVATVTPRAPNRGGGLLSGSSSYDTLGGAMNDTLQPSTEMTAQPLTPEERASNQKGMNAVKSGVSKGIDLVGSGLIPGYGLYTTGAGLANLAGASLPTLGSVVTDFAANHPGSYTDIYGDRSGGGYGGQTGIPQTPSYGGLDKAATPTPTQATAPAQTASTSIQPYVAPRSYLGFEGDPTTYGMRAQRRLYSARGGLASLQGMSK